MRSLFLCVLGVCVSTLTGCPQPPPPDASDVVTDQPVAMDVQFRDVRDVATDVRDVTGDVRDASDVQDVFVPFDAGCQLDAIYSYGFEGGMPPFSDVSALSPMRSFTRRRTFLDTSMPPIECTNELPMCMAMDVINIGDVLQTIHDPDVQNALSQPIEVVFGFDSRTLEGQVFGFHRSDGRGFFVGEPCSGRAGCIEVPDSLAILVGYLSALDSQQLADPACAMLR